MGRKVESINKIDITNGKTKTSKEFRNKQKVKKDSGFLNVFIDACEQNNVLVITKKEKEQEK